MSGDAAVLSVADPATQSRDGSWMNGLPWGILGLGALAVGPILAQLWNQPDFTHGWVLAVMAAWGFYRLRGAVSSSPRAPSRHGLWLVATAAIAFPPTWYLREVFGPRQAVVWLLGVSLLAAAAGLLALGHGWPRIVRLAFPFLFLFLALPPPGTLFTFLEQVLKRLAIGASTTALSHLGQSVVQTGFVLRLPSGPLLISEACSGIRSLTTLITFAFVIAFVRSKGIRGGALLALLAVPVAIAGNTVRIVATALLQESGRASVGAAHEALGALVVAGGVALLLGASAILPGGDTHSVLASRPTPTPAPARLWLPATLCLAASLAAVLVIDHAGKSVAQPLLAETPREILGLVGTDGPLDATWKAMGYDTALRRFYDDGSGQPVGLFVGFWLSELAIGPHDPDLCWPAQGWTPRSAETRHVRPRNGGAPVEVSIRRYNRDGAEWTFLMWAQQGNVVLSPHPGPFESRNVLRVLQRPPDTKARLFVLLSLKGDTEATSSRLEAFASALMVSLYRLCPWATPRT